MENPVDQDGKFPCTYLWHMADWPDVSAINQPSNAGFPALDAVEKRDLIAQHDQPKAVLAKAASTSDGAFFSHQMFGR